MPRSSPAFGAFASFAALALFGCDAPPVAKEPPPVVAAPPLPAPDRSSAPPVSAPPVASSSPPAAAPPPPAPPARFGQIELATTRGDLTPLLRDEVQRAKQKGLVPLIYFYAEWCPPCRAFQQQMKAPEIEAALEGTYLVKLNLDDWHDKLRGTGFAPKKIPSFYLINDAGRPTGKTFDGDNWGKAPSPARMAAAIKAFRGPSSPPP